MNEGVHPAIAGGEHLGGDAEWTGELKLSLTTNAADGRNMLRGE